MLKSKRVHSFLLAVLILASWVLPITTAQAATDAVQLTVSTDKVTAAVGEQITVTVSTSEIQNLGALSNVLRFDKEKIGFVSASNKLRTFMRDQEEIDEGWADISSTLSTDTSVNGFIGISALNQTVSYGYTIPADTVLYTAVFTVKAGALNGATSFQVDTSDIQVRAEVAVITNESGGTAAATVSAVPATVTITGGVNPPITGSVSISGSAVYGQTLTAVPSGTPSGATLQYQWYRGEDAIAGAANAAYTIAAADIGSALKVVLSAEGHDGTRTAQTGTVAKASKSEPAGLAVESKTDTQVTLGTIPGAEYAKNTIDEAPETGWQESPVFMGLTANTTYYFFAKYPETQTHEASGASASLEVTTEKTVRSVSVTVAPAGGGTAAYEVEGGGAVTQGKTINLTATPNSDYYFSNWTSEDVTITDADSAANAYFTMPDENVAVAANFTEKAQPVITLSGNTVTYDGNPHAIGTPVVSGAEGNIAGGITITYTKEGESAGATTPPTNVGAYTVVASFAENAYNKAATSEPVILNIQKRPQTTPGAPNVTGSDTESVTFDTVAGQKYVVIPAADAVPAIGSASWVEGTGSPYIWTGLNPGTAYKVYTYKATTENDLASDISEGAAISTKHTWGLSVTEGANPVAALSFFARAGYATAPAARTITLTNEGSGTLSGISAVLTDTGSAFTLNTTGFDGELAAGESTTFTVQPQPGKTIGSYAASVAIEATKSGEAESNKITKSIDLSFEVANKIVVAIGGLSSKTVPYNGSQQGYDASSLTKSVPGGQTPYGGSLQIWYEGTSGTVYTRSQTAPVDAGTYIVTAQVPDSDADYMGSASVTLTIEKKELTIAGLSVTGKVYNRSDAAALTGGTLSGIVSGDEVSVAGGIPYAGTFASLHQGTHAVNIPILTLTGADAANYSLAQPSPTGTITPKGVTPVVTVADKEYDGTADVAPASISATFAPGAILEGDAVNVSFAGGSYANKNVGADKDVTLGSMTVTGNANGDYAVSAPVSPKADITPKPVTVTVSGEAEATYTGSAKTLVATYPTLGTDTASVTLQYNGSSAPILAGAYAVTAQINDANYTLNALAGVTTLTIHKGTLTASNVNKVVRSEDTREQTVNATDFAIAAPAGSQAPTGTYGIGTVTDTDAILDGAPVFNNGVITFKIKASAAIGKQAVIPVAYTPAANTYEEITANIAVSVAAEGYTNTIVGAPGTVKLGEDIALSGMKLRTEFASGKPAEEIAVTSAMLSGYDKNATGEGSIGSKTVTVTHPQNANRNASFTILVEDVVADYTITPPTKLIYHWMADAALDLAGASIQPSMRSTLAANPVALTADMLNVSNATLARLGTYPVNVVYAGITKTAAFTLEVKQAPVSIITPPAPNRPGVVNLGPETTFATAGGQAVAPADVELVVAPVSGGEAAALQAAVEEQPAFANVPQENLLTLEISLQQIGTNAAVQPNGKIKLRLPYPAGTSALDTFVILHKKGDGSVVVYTPDKTADGLEFEVESFSAFALGWIDYVPSSGGLGGGGGFSRQMRANQFWEQVRKAIVNASDGSVVRVNAQNYDQMPIAVMNALRNASITLIISWNGGMDIVLSSENAPMPENTRAYYPLQYLGDLFLPDPPKTDDPEEGEAWLRAQAAAVAAPVAQSVASGLGTVIDIIAPDILEDEQDTVTPATEGFLIPQTQANTQADSVEMVDASEGSHGMPIWAIALTAVAVLGGAAVLVLNRRKAFHKD